MNVRFLTGVIELIFLGGTCVDQSMAIDADSLEKETYSLPPKANVVELRPAIGEYSIEYRRYWFRFMSTDLEFGAGDRHQYASIALSLYPMPLFFLQSSVGIGGASEGGAELAEPFNAGYVVGIRFGMLFPMGRSINSPFYVSLTGGWLWFVDKNYRSYGFSFYEPSLSPKPIVSTRSIEKDMLQVGLGYRF
jgi:hypothetical protein